jgi:hypothetical protein
MAGVVAQPFGRRAAFFERARLLHGRLVREWGFGGKGEPRAALIFPLRVG